MPSGENFLKESPAITVLLNSHFGGGKTRAGMGFPDVYAIGYDPNGLDILKQKELEGLRKNLIWYEYINPATDDELRDAYRKTPKDGKVGLLYQILAHVEELARAKKIKTLFFDGVTYFTDLRWRLINLDEIVKSEKTGNVDTQTMYRNLSIWLQTFFARDLLPFATRHKLNVVCTCHLKREGEEAVQGSDKTGRAGKINKMSDIAPMIEGGFRNKIEGLFGASIYLERKLDASGQNIQYFAHTNIRKALGTVVEGKNRYGLAPSFDITNKSLYEVIQQNLSQEKL